MDPREFDRLVARIFAERDRRAAVKGLLAGAAAAAVPAFAEAKKHKGKDKDKNRKDKRDKRKHKAHDEGKAQNDKSQVTAEAQKKKFCLCKGTSAAQCTPTNCVGCEYQGKIGKNKRDSIKAQFPFSQNVNNASECPGNTTTTVAPTTTTTTTTARVCGGNCLVGSNTCAQQSGNNLCTCRGTSVVAGSPGTCTTAAGVCAGQTCTTGAFDECGQLGFNCVCRSSGLPGSTGTCGAPVATTTTTRPPLPPNTCPGGSCTLGSCSTGCACFTGICVPCVRPSGGSCQQGEICCNTAALCPGSETCP